MNRGVRQVLVFVAQVVLLFCSHGLPWRSTMRSEQCEVTDVNVAADEEASTFIFNLTYRNRSCLGKEKLTGRLIHCDGKTQSYSFPVEEGEGQVIDCPEPGAWKVTVNWLKNNGSGGHVESACFNASGLLWSPRIRLFFTYKELEIHVLNPDHRVITWHLTTYKFKKAGSFTCNKRSNMEQINDLFQNMRNLHPQSVNGTDIKLTHDFDPDGCYCFVMKANASVNLWQTSFPVSTKTCRPIHVLPAYGTEAMNSLPYSTNETAEMMVEAAVVVTVILIAVGVIAVTLMKPKLLSKLLALKLTPAEGVKRRSLSKLLSQDVLLLHAPDVSGSEQLTRLKNYLQVSFKVYGIFENNDLEKLADPSGWVQKMILKSSGVKLLVVESVGLQERMSTLLSTSIESNSKVTRKVNEMSPVARNADNLLAFALRHILCTTLREDYSRVFIVRLADDLEQTFLHVEDGLDLIVKMKRYILPDHYQMLKDDMLQ